MQTKKENYIHEKLSSKWKGPYIIIRKLEYASNCLVISAVGDNTAEEMLVNIKEVKRYFERPEWMILPEEESQYSYEEIVEDLVKDSMFVNDTEDITVALHKVLGK